MACVLFHTSDFEPQIAEPFPYGKIVMKKYPRRLCKPGVLFLNIFFHWEMALAIRGSKSVVLVESSVIFS